MAVPCNKYSFCCIRRLALSCIKTNLRENRFFATSWALVDKKGTFCVKILAEKCTRPHPQPQLASPPTPLQGERGVVCFVG